MRDLLLGRPVRDVDLVVVGDGTRFARLLAAELGVPARVHERFSTATLDTEGRSIDVATARRESYDRPGALPRVEPSARIEVDLFRRDFTINAMALEIAPGRRLRLHDPFGGRADLAKKQIRILHPRSFEDDPTRAVRAVRYATRLKFSIDPKTRQALRQAARGRFIDSVSGERLRRELALLLSELDREDSVRSLDRFGVARAIDPSLRVGAQTARRLRETERTALRLKMKPDWIAYLLSWVGALKPDAATALADRLRLSGRERRTLLSWPSTLSKLRSPPRFSPSSVAKLDLSAEELLASLAVLPGPARRDILRAIRQGPVELEIAGRDLVKAGLAPGPEVGRALARTLAARRDGMISREEELEFALRSSGKSTP